MVWTPPGFDHCQVRNCYEDETPLLGLVLHVQAGNNSPFVWFDNADSLSSSTWWAGKCGEREQFIDPDTERAWAQAGGNKAYHSIETEGEPADPLTAEQIESVAQAFAAGHTRYGWPLQLAEKPGDRGLIWHGAGGVAWGNHPGCPGAARRAQMPAIVARAKEIAGEKEPTVTVTADGWPARNSYSASFRAPNGHVCDVVSKNAAIVFAEALMRLDTEVARITVASGARTIAQQTRLYRNMGLTPILDSNHVSGTAVDAGPPGVVYEPNQRGAYRSGYTAAQEARIRDICKDSGVLQWGGDFYAPYRDPIHIQLTEDLHSRYRRVVSSRELANAAKRAKRRVTEIQKAVGATADGIAGPGTISAVRDFQKEHGLKVDGIFGPASRRAAGIGVKPKPKPKPKRPTLKPDGVFGEASVRELMNLAGVRGNAVLSSQSSSQRDRLPGITAIQFVSPSAARGSLTVAWLQRVIGVHDDGILGPGTIGALQRFLREHGFPRTPIDYVWGSGLSERVQRAINRGVLK